MSLDRLLDLRFLVGRRKTTIPDVICLTIHCTASDIPGSLRVMYFGGARKCKWAGLAVKQCAQGCHSRIGTFHHCLCEHGGTAGSYLRSPSGREDYWAITDHRFLHYAAVSRPLRTMSRTIAGIPKMKCRPSLIVTISQHSGTRTHSMLQLKT